MKTIAQKQANTQAYRDDRVKLTIKLDRALYDRIVKKCRKYRLSPKEVITLQATEIPRTNDSDVWNDWLTGAIRLMDEARARAKRERLTTKASTTTGGEA